MDDPAGPAAGTPPPGMAGAPAAGADPWATFDRWAGNVFLLLALLTGLGVLVVAGAAHDLPPGVLAITIGAIALGTGLLAVAMVGLRDATSWARPASVALLWAILVMGVVQVVADLGVGRITVPLGTILAAAVLWKRPAERPRAALRDRRIAWLFGVLYVIAMLPGPLAPLVAARGP